MPKKRGVCAFPDTEIRVFDGVTYRRRPGKRYFETMRWDKEARRYWSDSLHRAVWRKHNGDIPPGHDIHHRDEDLDNNEPDNLVCLSRKEHNRTHDSFSEWNRRPEAEEQRRKNRKKAWENMPYRDKVCRHCGVRFSSRHPDPNRPYYCSLRCGELWRGARVRPGSGGGS